MDQETYKKITTICKSILYKDLHCRHLEEMIQTVAMNYWIKKGKANISWLALNYLRESGFGSSGKQGAKNIGAFCFCWLLREF